MDYYFRAVRGCCRCGQTSGSDIQRNRIVHSGASAKGEHVIAKKAFGGFAATQLDTVLRNLAAGSSKTYRTMTSAKTRLTVFNFALMVLQGDVGHG